MHNMIINNGRGQNFDYTSMTSWEYVFGRLEGKTESNALWRCTMTSERPIRTMIFKKISWRSAGHGMGNWPPSFISIFVVLCMNYVVLFAELRCICFAFHVVDLMNYVII